MRQESFSLSDGRLFYYQTVDVMLNGVQQTIIPLKSEFSMTSQAKSKDEILTGISAEQILPTVLCFCNPNIFVNEGKPLFTLSGEIVPSELLQVGTPLVYLDKADNVQLLTNGELEPLPATIVNCENVSDAVAKMAASAYVSQVPTKNDWMGYAGANDITLAIIKAFADKYRVAGTVAQAYFGVKAEVKMLKNIAVFGNQNITGARTEAQAIKLLEAVVQAFGVKCAGQTRYLKGVNYAIKTYGLDITIQALNNIGGAEKLQIAAASCEEKAACLQDLLTLQISELTRLQLAQQEIPVAQAV